MKELTRERQVLSSKFNVARPNQGARANKVDSGSAARVGSQQTNEENSEAEPG